MSTLILKNIHKSFGAVDIIRGVDLDIRSGEFVVFVGPSGCGKSTLLRMISGLETTSSGTISIRDRDVTHVPPAKRGIAMVFQSYALFPHMSVADNITFGLRLQHAGKEEIARKLTEIADILHLTPLLDRRPKQLSGGQRQRVAIGRAIVRNPAVFLFDEPLSNLDAELRVSMRVEIAKLHRRIGATMIYVTHDQTEAMTLADKIIVMRSGKIEQAGTPDALYADPDNLFVAGFIGSPRMNFLGGILEADGQVRLDCGATFRSGILPAPTTPSAPITLGIRPEHFTGTDEAGGTVDVRVDMVENLGGTRFVYGTLKSGQAVIVEDRSESALRDGASISAGFPARKALLFDAEGRRIRSSDTANAMAAQ